MENEERGLVLRKEYTADERALIKETVAKGLTDLELKLFEYQCRRTGLDPFNRQIHAVKRWDSTQKKKVMTIQVGIDGYRLISERTGNIAPGREPTFHYKEDGALLSATAYLWKQVGDRWFEVSATAFYDEYVQKKKDGIPNHFWGKMPHSQLAKCAETLAHRKCSPQDLSGLYTHAEMMQAGPSVEGEFLVGTEEGKVLSVPDEEATEAEAIQDAFPQAEVKEVSIKQEERWARGLKKHAEELKYPPEDVEEFMELWASSPRDQERYEKALKYMEANAPKGGE